MRGKVEAEPRLGVVSGTEGRDAQEEEEEGAGEEGLSCCFLNTGYGGACHGGFVALDGAAERHDLYELQVGFGGWGGVRRDHAMGDLLQLDSSLKEKTKLRTTEVCECC